MYGDKARVHIFGDDETASVANQAVLDYKVDRIEAQRAAVHSDHDTCQPSDPCPNCLVPDPPDDDSFGRHNYGYNALVYIYGDKAAARAGYTAAMAHKKGLALLAAADAHDPSTRTPATSATVQTPRTVSCHRGGFQTRLPWPSDAETRHNRPIPSPLTRPLHNRHTGEGRYPDGRGLS